MIQVESKLRPKEADLMRIASCAGVLPIDGQLPAKGSGLYKLILDLGLEEKNVILPEPDELRVRP